MDEDLQMIAEICRHMSQERLMAFLLTILEVATPPNVECVIIYGQAEGNEVGIAGPPDRELIACLAERAFLRINMEPPKTMNGRGMILEGE